MTNDVTLTCRLNKAYLPVMNTQQLVYVLIEAAPGAAMAQVQMPLNLSLVLDKSGSMQGKKIQNLRDAAKLVVDRLGPQDSISIIAFSDKKYLIAPSQQVADKDELVGPLGDEFCKPDCHYIGTGDARVNGDVIRSGEGLETGKLRKSGLSCGAHHIHPVRTVQPTGYYDAMAGNFVQTAQQIQAIDDYGEPFETRQVGDYLITG